MDNEQLNLTYLLDDYFGAGQWESKLKDVLFRSMFKCALNDDITDNSEAKFLNSVHWIISNLIQDRQQAEKVGDLEVFAPSTIVQN